MKFYAVFKTVVEKHIELDADNWQDAARIANAMGRQKVEDTACLEVVAMCACEYDGCDCAYYESAHELVGPCNKCGFQILERGCSPTCQELHQHSPTDSKYKKGGGYVTTKHAHVIWCSQACRDADRANDPEVEVLDRMAGVADDLTEPS